MPPQYACAMKGLGKAATRRTAPCSGTSGCRSFRGAKLGVPGAGGRGHVSTLPRIMAGEIAEFDGEAFPARGLSTGCLPREPRPDPPKTVSRQTSARAWPACARCSGVATRWWPTPSSGLVSPDDGRGAGGAGRAAELRAGQSARIASSGSTFAA